MVPSPSVRIQPCYAFYNYYNNSCPSTRYEPPLKKARFVPVPREKQVIRQQPRSTSKPATAIVSDVSSCAYHHQTASLLAQHNIIPRTPSLRNPTYTTTATTTTTNTTDTTDTTITNNNTRTPPNIFITVQSTTRKSLLLTYALCQSGPSRTPSPPRLRPLNHTDTTTITTSHPSVTSLLGNWTRDLSGDSGRNFISPGGGEWKKRDWLIAAVTRDLEELSLANKGEGAIISSSPNIVSISGNEDDNNNNKYKVFFSQHEQPFSMDFYVARLVKYFSCSSAAFVAALVYLDRVHVRLPMLALVDMNAHRLLATALLLAVKYLDDQVCTNSYYAKVAGICTEQFNTLEAIMLDILDWRLAIAPDLFARYQHSLLAVAARDEE